MFLKGKNWLQQHERVTCSPDGHSSCCVLAQLVAKWYPLKAACTLKKKKNKEEIYSLQREATWDHKALLGFDSILYARCSQQNAKSLKTEAYLRRTGKRIEPRKVQLCSCSPDTFLLRGCSAVDQHFDDLSCLNKVNTEYEHSDWVLWQQVSISSVEVHRKKTTRLKKVVNCSWALLNGRRN